MTLLALVVAVTAGAQGTTIHEYPWNPDWNNDNFVGSSDLTGFLSAFGSEFGNPPEPCDYDGTPLEDLVIGIADGSIILDSIYMEYELEDVSTYYVLGCPDPITDTLVFSNSMLLNYVNVQRSYLTGQSTNTSAQKWRGDGHALENTTHPPTHSSRTLMVPAIHPIIPTTANSHRPPPTTTPARSPMPRNGGTPPGRSPDSRRREGV